MNTIAKENIVHMMEQKEEQIAYLNRGMELIENMDSLHEIIGEGKLISDYSLIFIEAGRALEQLLSALFVENGYGIKDGCVEDLMEGRSFRIGKTGNAISVLTYASTKDLDFISSDAKYMINSINTFYNAAKYGKKMDYERYEIFTNFFTSFCKWFMRENKELFHVGF